MKFKKKSTWDAIMIILAIVLIIFFYSILSTGCSSPYKSACQGNKKMLYHQGYSTRKMKV